MAVFGGWRVTRAGVLFIIGILLLGALVTGGIFLVKNHGEAVRRDEAVKIAEENLKNQSKVAVQPVNTDNSNTNSAATDTDKSTTTTTSTTTTSTQAVELPKTGPDSVSHIVAVTILALSVAFYVASRRTAKDL